MSVPTIREIRERLKVLNGNFEVVLYGSVAEGNTRPNSDIDISVLTHLTDKEKNKKIQYEFFGIAPLKYDIRIFELFPIYVQMSVIKNYKVIFGDPLDISEYFYNFRKKWDDCRIRILSNQFKSVHEQLMLMDLKI